MAGQWSEAVQKTHLAEGLAAAALTLGVHGITSARFDLDRAFERAWAAWPHAGKFPQMRTGLSRNDLVSVLDSSSRRRAAYTAYWDTELPARYYTPVLRDRNEDAADALRFIAKQTGIPAEDWRALTGQFVDEIARWGEDDVLRPD